MTKKKAVTQFKRLNKSENLVTQITPDSYYVKDDPEPVLVFNDHGNWVCDCDAYSFNLTDVGTSKDCFHITTVKKFIGRN